MQTNIAGVGGACSQCMDHTGFAPVQGKCASWVSTAPGCSAGELSKGGPVFHALPRSNPLRCSGTPQGQTRLGMRFVSFPGPSSSGNQVFGERTVPGGPCILITSPVPAVQFPGGPARALSQPCVSWAADLRLRPSWQMSTIQDPRKTWLATGSLLTVWCRMPVSGTEIGAVRCLPTLAFARLPRGLWWGRGGSCTQPASFPLVFNPSFCEPARESSLSLFFPLWGSHSLGCYLTLAPSDCPQGIQAQSLP